jgi:VanZ family protein
MQQGPFDTPVAPTPLRRASPLARLACWVYFGIVIYASLTPWSGWRDLGVGAFAYLTAPWPERVTRFDIIVNVLGYFPLGMLVVLALYPQPRGATAVALALLAALLLSGSVEALQTFLPRRVSSKVDLVSNLSGALLGAAFGAWRAQALIDRGRLLELRYAWFIRDASIPLTLLALWPIAQLPAVAMLFTMGPADASLLDWAHQHGLTWLPARGAWTPPEFIVAEAVVTTTAVLAVGLTAATAMQPRAPRARLVLALIGVALLAKMLAYGMRFGGEHVLAWFTPGAVGGLVIGGLAAVVASWGPPRAVARLAVLATLGLIAAVCLIPENPYFAHWQSQWRTGRLAHFNALGEWVAFAWPFATMSWLVSLEFSRRPRRRDAAGTQAGN